jgi:hypothetical protein
MPATVFAVDHTGITVNSLDLSVGLRRDVRLVELVGYVSPADTETSRPRDVGSVHVAFTVADIAAYVHGPDGLTLQLIQLVPSQPGRPGEQS